jgi:7-cyano-7-deazaguanine synthase in queuosine biosynthesis
MVGTRVVATPIPGDAAAAHSRPGTIGVGLYLQGTSSIPGLGNHLRESAEKFLPKPPSEAAWDFLSLALAAFAADRFVLRSDAEDGWTRVIALDIALSNPKAWEPVTGRLEAALRFLTGDIWQISVRGGGAAPPQFPPKLTDRDAICLFSGGLDSLLGALRLLDLGRRPFLVSQGSPKEIHPQESLAKAIKLSSFRFDGRVNERWIAPYEGSTRGRSLIFFAYGAVAASAHGLDELFIPENGLIAINPPFTPRRLGSLSTRTTHPFFLSELQTILHSTGNKIALTNMFEGMTKGEMLSSCKHPDIEILAGRSYSCGKGKRLNGQCGRCVPCLIRRASFAAAGVPDRTYYKTNIEGSKKNDDVIAARIATARAANASIAEIARWSMRSGPLPDDRVRRGEIVGAVSRGLAELGDFLNGVQWR